MAFPDSQVRRSHLAGRRHGRLRTAVGSGIGRGVEAAVHCGEQGGCKRQHRRGNRDEGRAGWLYLSRFIKRAARHKPQPLQEPRLQCGA